jgi:glyoxylase-like metal-dependent hydrolase (beta-lactamase superfamily II)
MQGFATLGRSLMVAALLLSGAVVQGQVVRTADADVRGFRASDFPRITQLADNVYAYEDLMGELGTSFAFTTNSLIVVTSQGVLVADAQGSVAKTKRMIDEIGKLTTQPIKYVVICADHMDHIAGNSAFPAGVTFIAHPTSKAVIERAAARLAQNGSAPIPVPQETVADKRTITLGGMEMQILFLGRAHTGGDLQLYLPRERLLFMSEVFFNRLYPSVGGSKSARPIEWIETIKKSEALAAKIVVPGHGFVDSQAVLQEELVAFRLSLENLVSESRRLHDAKVPAEAASRSINLGEFQYWYRAVNNVPDAIAQVYMELDGKLN